MLGAPRDGVGLPRLALFSLGLPSAGVQHSERPFDRARRWFSNPSAASQRFHRLFHNICGRYTYESDRGGNHRAIEGRQIHWLRTATRIVLAWMKSSERLKTTQTMPITTPLQASQLPLHANQTKTTGLFSFRNQPLVKNRKRPTYRRPGPRPVTSLRPDDLTVDPTWRFVDRGYHDIDATRRGPRVLAAALRQSIDQVFPIRYDLRTYVQNAPPWLEGAIRRSPRQRLARAQIIALAVP